MGREISERHDFGGGGTCAGVGEGAAAQESVGGRRGVKVVD